MMIGVKLIRLHVNTQPHPTPPHPDKSCIEDEENTSSINLLYYSAQANYLCLNANDGGGLLLFVLLLLLLLLLLLFVWPICFNCKDWCIQIYKSPTSEWVMLQI